MALSGPRSGKHAVFTKGGTAIDGISRWSLNSTFTPEDHVHSSSLGAHNRLGGVYDWSGTVEGFGAHPGLFPGEQFAAEFFTAPDTGVYGAAGMKYDGNCIVDSLTITWNWAAGGTMQWSAGVSSNGCLTTTAAGDEIDTVTGCKYEMCGILPQNSPICGAAVWATIPNVSSATLTLTSANPAYANSSTACCTKREPGNLDWSLDLVDEETNMQFTPGTFYRFKIFVGNALFWVIDAGLYIGPSNLVCDVETGAIIQKSNTFVGSGNYCCSGTQTTGTIIDPTPTTKWPVIPA